MKFSNNGIRVSQTTPKSHDKAAIVAFQNLGIINVAKCLN